MTPSVRSDVGERSSHGLAVERVVEPGLGDSPPAAADECRAGRIGEQIGDRASEGDGIVRRAHDRVDAIREVARYLSDGVGDHRSRGGQILADLGREPRSRLLVVEERDEEGMRARVEIQELGPAEIADEVDASAEPSLADLRPQPVGPRVAWGGAGDGDATLGVRAPDLLHRREDEPYGRPVVGRSREDDQGFSGGVVARLLLVDVDEDRHVDDARSRPSPVLGGGPLVKIGRDGHRAGRPSQRRPEALQHGGVRLLRPLALVDLAHDRHAQEAQQRHEAAEADGRSRCPEPQEDEIEEALTAQLHEPQRTVHPAPRGDESARHERVVTHGGAAGVLERDAHVLAAHDGVLDV